MLVKANSRAINPVMNPVMNPVSNQGKAANNRDKGAKAARREATKATLTIPQKTQAAGCPEIPERQAAAYPSNSIKLWTPTTEALMTRPSNPDPKVSTIILTK